MKKSIIKVFSIISILLLLPNVVYAESGIIVAPTKPLETRNIDQDFVVKPSNNVEYSTAESQLTSDPGMLDAFNIYNAVEDSNGHIYCVGLDGNYVKNAWRKISLYSYENFGVLPLGFIDNYVWMYFNNTGRAIKGTSNRMKRYRIDGEHYAFNESGMMIKGFFNDEGEIWDDNNNSDPFDLLNGSNYLYYADEYTGALKSGWMLFNEGSDKYDWKSEIWLYFSPTNFRSIRANNNYYKLQNIGNKKYAFDSNGVMLTGMESLLYDSDSNEKIRYFNADGSVVTNGFVSVDFDDEFTEDMFSDYDYDEDITIYLSKSGAIYKDQVKKIDNYYYGFDENGVVIKDSLTIWYNGHFVDTISHEDTDAKRFMMNNEYVNKRGERNTFIDGMTIYYFDKRGRRVNSAKLEFSNDDYSYAASNNGAYEGAYNKKLYSHGLLVKSYDSKYGIYMINKTKDYYSSDELYGNYNTYVVNERGNIQTNLNGTKDDYEKYWLTNYEGNLLGVYSVKVKQGYYYSMSTNNKEEWIPFGNKDKRGRTEKDYLVKLNNESAINFNIANNYSPIK